MDNSGISFFGTGVAGRVHIIIFELSEMRQITTHHYTITPVIDIGPHFFSYAKRLISFLRNFKQLWFYFSKYSLKIEIVILNGKIA